MSKILVTGATGTVGGAVSAALIEKGIHFRVAAHSVQKAKTNPVFNTEKAKQLVEFVEIEFYNPATVENAVKGIEKIFLLTPPGQTHTAYTLVEAATKAGVKHIVKLSALGSEHPDKFIWAGEHTKVEEAIKKAGIALTSLRPSAFYSNFFNFIQTIKDQGTVYAALQDARLNLIDPRDIAAVAVIALTQPGHEGKEYYITGPDTLNYWEVVDLMSEVWGKKITYVPIDDEALRKQAATFLPNQQAIDAFSNMYLYFRNGGYNVNFPDLEKVTGSKGIPLRTWLQENAAVFK